MKRVPIRSLVQSVLEVKPNSLDLVGSPCPQCKTPLDLMQPDPDLPDRFLGACASCKGWYHIEIDPGGRVWYLAVPCRADVQDGADLHDTG
ncbi:hypothetical protein TA3x_001195 [Tundrisphaera sp. TA3]|uniref:hypothetical protein n=1 Tax=Tundrisphaera sp. TA3 TaxID=3435775 RepID=UPI003EBE48BB